jgi:Tol biopolymer transport system component
MKKLLAALIAVVCGWMLLAAPGAAAGGTGPDDALLPDGTPLTIPAHSAVWFQFDVGHSTKTLVFLRRRILTLPRAPIFATVDDNHASGIRMAIYTPDEISNWQKGNGLSAVGMGSSSGTNGHDLLWTGSFSLPGTYYAVVYNDSDANVTASVRVSGDNVTTTVEVVPTPTPMTNPFAVQTPLGQGLGGKLVFEDATGGNIYTVNGDGTNLTQISFGMDPQWNHSGTQIALARQGPVPGIYTINADGSNERMLYQTNEPRAPDWSPDDSQIVFSFHGAQRPGGQRCFRGHCFSTNGVTPWQLGILNAASGDYTDVRTSNYAFTPTWNADGTTIAYEDTSIGMMTTSPNGSQSQNPFIGDLRITSTAYNPLHTMSPQYSPDGKQIVYMVEQTPTWQIAVANADGSNQRLLTRMDPLDFVHPSNVAPVWSPDGKQILFLSDRNGKWEFFVMNADGTGTQQVLKNVTDQITIKYDFQAGRMMSWAR